MACLSHLREAFQRLGERFDRLVGVPFFNALAYAMAEMSVEDDERQAVERPVLRVKLREDVLSGDVFRKHLLYACQLSDDLLQPQLERRHIFNAFSHGLLSLFEIGAYYTIPP